MLSSQRSILSSLSRRRQRLSCLEAVQRRHARGGGGFANRTRINKQSTNHISSEQGPDPFLVAEEAPTRTQLWRVFCHAALPMIGKSQKETMNIP